MSTLSNDSIGRGFTHVSRIDLDSFNQITGNASQTITLFTEDNARLLSASILCPEDLTSSSDVISASLGDSGSTDAFITSTTISGLGADAGVVATADIDGVAAAPDTIVDSIMGNPGLAIDTNFDIKAANAFDILIAGYAYTLAADTSFDTGTAAVITADKWGCAVCSTDDAGSTSVDWLHPYDSEAEAIAAGVALISSAGISGELAVGFATVLTGSGVTWTAGTDALQGGTGGTPSADTNYYNYSPSYAATAAQTAAIMTGLGTVTNGKAITTSVNLTLALDGGNWSANNGAEFFVLMNIATPEALV